MTSPLRVLRQIVAPSGRHRKPLLPEPSPQAEPVLHEDGTDTPETTTPAGAA